MVKQGRQEIPEKRDVLDLQDYQATQGHPVQRATMAEEEDVEKEAEAARADHQALLVIEGNQVHLVNKESAVNPASQDPLDPREILAWRDLLDL